MEGKVTLSEKEVKRLTVLIRTETGGITGRQASEVMGICLRHERRLLAAYRKEGVAALAHGNRGKKAPNAIEEEVRQQVIKLV